MAVSLLSSLIYAPSWFYGFDIAIDILSLTVLLLIAIFSFRAYRLGGRKTHLVFSISFLLLTLSFVAKVISNFVLYYFPKRISSFAIAVSSNSFLSFAEIKAIGISLYSSIFLYRALMIIGLYILFFTYYHKKTVNKSFFVPELFIFVILVLLFSYTGFSSYYLFHIVAFIILFFITRNYYYLYHDALLKYGSKQASLSVSSSSSLLYRSLLVARSFSLITVSQLLFIFSNAWDNNIYALAEIVQLAGYLLLLLTFVVVLFDGSKKK